MKAGYRQKAASILASWVEQKWALSNSVGVYQLLSHPLSQHLTTHPHKKTTALKSFCRSRINLDKPAVNWKKKWKTFKISGVYSGNTCPTVVKVQMFYRDLWVPRNKFRSDCLFPSSSVLFITSHWCFSVCKPIHHFIASLAVSQQLLASAKPCSCSRNGTDFNLQFARKRASELPSFLPKAAVWERNAGQTISPFEAKTYSTVWSNS